MSGARPSILVTGAAGFVGQHLLAALRAQMPAALLHTQRLDVTDREAVFAAVRATAPTHCVHLAAISAIGDARNEPELAWRVNLDGTLNVAAAMQAEAGSGHLLFVSSADAYGATFRTGRHVDETAALAPLNTYAATKAAADLAMGAMAAEGLRVIRLRAFNHTGPGQRADFAVAAFARQIARIEHGLQPPVLRVGALDPERDFLDVRDVVAAYVAAIERADAIAPGTILNIASGVPRRIGDVLEALLAQTVARITVETDAERLRPSDIPRAAGNPARAHAVLGWRPAIAWERTMVDVLDDWRGKVGAPPQTPSGRADPVRTNSPGPASRATGPGPRS